MAAMDYAASSPAFPTPVPLPWQRQPLAPLQPVQTLHVRTGETAVLETERGRVWLTCEGRPEDHFLEAGQRLQFAGPARLRVSADGRAAAYLRWALSPA
jgi:hypothetical protein